MIRVRIICSIALLTIGVLGQNRVVQVGGNPQRTNVFVGEPLPSPKSPKWRTTSLFSLGGRRTSIVEISGLPFNSFGVIQSSSGHGFSIPMVHDGKIVFTLFINDGLVIAQDKATGKDAWRIRKKTTRLSAPAVADGKVFLSTDDGSIMALDVATGKEVWSVRKQKTSGASVFPPLFLDGKVYFSMSTYGINLTDRGDAALYAVDAATGGEVWTYKTKGTILTPATDGKNIFLSFREGDLKAVDIGNGREVWSTGISTQGISSPLVAGDKVIVTSSDGTIHLVDSQAGRTRSKFSRIEPVTRPLSLFADAIYYCGERKHLYSISAVTGDLRWKYETDKACQGPIISGGQLYITTADGDLRSIDRETGNELWAIVGEHKFASLPTFEGDNFYMIDPTGRLYFFN